MKIKGRSQSKKRVEKKKNEKDNFYFVSEYFELL